MSAAGMLLFGAVACAGKVSELDGPAEEAKDAALVDATADSSGSSLSADSGSVFDVATFKDVEPVGECGSDYKVVPCCGGPTAQCSARVSGSCPPGTSASAGCPAEKPCVPGPCKAQAPFCAPLPAGCAPGKSCGGLCPNGSQGVVDAEKRVVQCMCA